MTYPNGKVLSYDYAAGMPDALGRLSSLSDPSGILESLDYLGLGIVVRRGHPQPGVDLTYIKQAGESDGDAGDQYTGLDRFGRVADQRWLKTSDGSHTDRFQYGHDRNSNRLYRENLVNSAFSELYRYDPLNQLASFQRGMLNGSKDGIVGSPSRSQKWVFDALGNWDCFSTDGVNQSRTHNRENQILSVSGWATLAYDANGNMTGDEQGRTLEYDAWNRLVEVRQASTVLANYTRDALDRRVVEDNRALYYSADWQVLEERQSGVVVVQMVFSRVYIDALVLREQDTDVNGSPDERLWVHQDANWGVTGLVDGNGSIVERYAIEPFGARTIMTSGWGSLTGSVYGWQYFHQGGRFDSAAGLYDFRKRHYSSITGRWLTLDPIGFLAKDLNLYRYVNNSPVTFLDAMGERAEQPCPNRCGPNIDFWLTDKIRENLQHPLVIRVHNYYWMQAFGAIGILWKYSVYAEFRDLVKARGPWDFKAHESFKTRLCPKGKCSYTVTLCGMCVSAEVPGNLHYGVLGAAIGIPDTILLDQAAKAQQGGIDDSDDIAAIKLGIEYIRVYWK